jgi:hypothetical protein
MFENSSKIELFNGFSNQKSYPKRSKKDVLEKNVK